MSKWAEVTIKATKTFLVEIESNETLEQANEYALGEMGFGMNSEIHESMFINDVDQSKAHADEIIPLL